MVTPDLSNCEVRLVVVQIVAGPFERHPSVITAQGYCAINSFMLTYTFLWGFQVTGDSSDSSIVQCSLCHTFVHFIDNLTIAKLSHSLSLQTLPTH